MCLLQHHIYTSGKLCPNCHDLECWRLIRPIFHDLYRFDISRHTHPKETLSLFQIPFSSTGANLYHREFHFCMICLGLLLHMLVFYVKISLIPLHFSFAGLAKLIVQWYFHHPKAKSIVGVHHFHPQFNN